MLQNSMSLDFPDSDTRSSRTVLKDKLVGKLVFDDPRVFKRLALDQVSPQFVANCAQAFTTDQDLLDARCELDRITAVATHKPVEELESDDEVHDSTGYRKVKKRFDEKKMYKPLRSLFQHVENFQDSSGTLPKHSFKSTDTKVLKLDSNTWGFPRGRPDFGMFECLSSTAIASGAKHVLWCQIGGFCEVKRTLQQGPKSKDPKFVKPVVCQAADYAQLHLSARPFQLFSVGLLIFGSEFCVAIFDRAGVLFSPVHDMWQDTEVFIRVIRSLTCHLSSVELGQDPTVTTLPDQQHKIWKNQTRDLGRDAPKDFPTFVIMMGGPGSPSWYTIGLPIWTSISLLGRGTSTWLVRENGAGPVLVLKNMWRSASWLSESMIYYWPIDSDHPALAKLHQHEDILFPGRKQHITAHNLRSPVLGDKIDGGDIFLHRLLLKTCGRPLWEHRSQKGLLQGICAALRRVLHIVGHSF
ncbi:hypothetical protein BYT27DRAFT_7333558 [Phlegmacium glaucopus]|nr:hypothetical protein BYT27DRAFT_7333558 [Phlegmacium glaucopus]